MVSQDIEVRVLLDAPSGCSSTVEWVIANDQVTEAASVSRSKVFVAQWTELLFPEEMVDGSSPSKDAKPHTPNGRAFVFGTNLWGFDSLMRRL